MKAIADIRVKIEHGATVEEINSAFDSHQYPELENAESQMAMVSVVEKVGQSAIVHEVLAKECSGKQEVDLQDVGFKSFVNTLATNSMKVDEIITQFEVEDFMEEVANDKLVKLAEEAKVCDIKTEDVPVQTTEKVNSCFLSLKSKEDISPCKVKSFIACSV